MSTAPETLTAQPEFESAGSLPLYQDDQDQWQIVVADRQKKPKDEQKDPSGQQDMLVGKPMSGETPSICNRREVGEETGGYLNDQCELEHVLLEDFEQRATPVVTTDPKHIIHVFIARLDDKEVARLKSADLELQRWAKNQDRDFSAITGCNVPARKASKGLYACPADQFLWHLIAFSKTKKTENRLNDAKEFVKEAPRVLSKSLGRPGVTIDHAFRPFVLVLLENFIPEIAEAIGLKTK